jgi:L-rhamnose mutarotase
MRQSFGAVVGIRPELIEPYCTLHANIWPDVVAGNHRAGLRNQSIFLLREKGLLFSYSEYVGTDRAADMARLAEDPVMRRWWSLCRPHQVPILPTDGPRRWTDLELVFHQP